MDRRTLLKLMAAVAATGCTANPGQTRRLRVVVVGAGIVGASIAYHLARSGARVTVIDAAGPATHASRGTFAWINATWAKQPRHYHALNQDSVADWHDLQAALNIPVTWGGSLEWFTDSSRTDVLTQQVAEQVAWGEPARMVSAAELIELEPGLEIDGEVSAAFSPNDGAVDPILATNALLSAAEQLGAAVQFPSAITAVRMVSGRLTGVETSSASIPADRLVLATGAAEQAPRDFAAIEIPQRSTPGVIVITRPLPRQLRRVIAAPGVHMHQRSDGRIVLGEQAGAPDTEAHALRLQGRPNDFPTEVFAQQHAARILSVAEAFLPGISAAEIESVYIGWRPLPLDGHPVLGASPARRDVYLAIMHSGVSLAPIVGQLLASEVINEEALPRLNEYRPGREFERVKRY